MTLLPGQAFFLTNQVVATSFTAPFTGLIPSCPATNVIVPGSNFVSSLIPLPGYIQTDLQYNPSNQDTVGIWNGSGFVFHTYFAITNGWSNQEPYLSVGEGCLLINSTTNTNFWIQTNLTVCPCNR